MLFKVQLHNGDKVTCASLLNYCEDYGAGHIFTELSEREWTALENYLMHNDYSLLDLLILMGDTYLIDDCVTSADLLDTADDDSLAQKVIYDEGVIYKAHLFPNKPWMSAEYLP